MRPERPREEHGLFRRARAMVFDFDGTLVDSNPIKRGAFARCFAEFPNQLEDILAYCWNNHDVPRGEKFRYVYEQILRRPYTDAVAAALHERFEAATTRQIIEGPEIRGAVEFLRRVSRSHLTGLLSSTPHGILLEILDGRGWRDWFDMIRGAPVSKRAWLTAFRTEHGFAAQDVVLFGDSEEDVAAAEAAGCSVVTVGNQAPAQAGMGHLKEFTHVLLP